MKFPIGIQSFEHIIQEGYIYILIKQILFMTLRIMAVFIFSAVRGVSGKVSLFLLWKTII